MRYYGDFLDEVCNMKLLGDSVYPGLRKRLHIKCCVGIKFDLQGHP
jgi:hypothetical protein